MASTDGAFLILHGWENFRPEGHWQYELARDLRLRGREVAYPQLPDANTPSVDEWSRAVREVLARLASEGRAVTVICHSLSALLWLGMRGAAGGDVERVLLVAPPSPRVISGLEAVAAFAGLTRPPLTASDAPTLIVASDDDPFCPEGAEAAFGVPLGIPVTVIPGAGHLNPTAGYGHWPSLTEWCLDASAPIVGLAWGAKSGIPAD